MDHLLYFPLNMAPTISATSSDRNGDSDRQLVLAAGRLGM